MLRVHSVIAFERPVSKRKHFEPVYNFCGLFSYNKYFNQYFQLQATPLNWCKLFQISWGDGGLCWLKFPSTHLRTCSLRWYRLWAWYVMMLGEFQVAKLSHNLKCLSSLCCWPWCPSRAELTMVLRNKKGIRYIVIIYFKTILFYFWCVR